MDVMDKVGLFTFTVEPYLTDFRGQVTLAMLGNYLIHAASNHAACRGFGFDDMTENHTAWVLSRLAIEMQDYPRSGASVSLYTWIEGAGKLFTSRCFEFVDGKGKTFGYARSVWAAIDIRTRRPTLLDVEELNRYIVERPCPIAIPKKIPPVEAQVKGIPYTVKYSDLDINGHLNSIKYIEHLLDLFDLERFKQKQIERFEIAYLSEGRYGMELSLHSMEVSSDHYRMAICNEGKAICRAEVVWK